MYGCFRGEGGQRCDASSRRSRGNPLTMRRLTRAPAIALVAAALALGVTGCGSLFRSTEEQAVVNTATNYERFLECASGVFESAGADVTSEAMTRSLGSCAVVDTVQVSVEEILADQPRYSGFFWLRDITAGEQGMILKMALSGRASLEGVTAPPASTRGVITCFNLYGAPGDEHVMVADLDCEDGLGNALVLPRGTAEVPVSELHERLDPMALPFVEIRDDQF